MIWRFLAWALGAEHDLLSRDEAVLVFMEREVTFTWRPVVVELAQESSFVRPPSDSVGSVRS